MTKVFSLVIKTLGHTTIQEVVKRHPFIASTVPASFGYATGKFSISKITKLVGVSFFEKNFTIHNHWAPNNTLRLLLRSGLIKIIHTYRDPRDVYLSALDMGKLWAQQERFKGNVVVRFYESDFQKQIDYLKKWVQVTLDWKETRGVFLVRYEDLVSNPRNTFTGMLDYCGYKVSQATLDRVLKTLNSPRAKIETHFNRGISSRYVNEMPPDIQKTFNAILGKEIVELGYSL